MSGSSPPTAGSSTPTKQQSPCGNRGSAMDSPFSCNYERRGSTHEVTSIQR
jgi:hypothetical protein